MKKHSAPILICLLLSLLLFAACSQEPARRGVQTDQYLVGAYYYVWYPANFHQGWLRGALKPPQMPVLGLYDSHDPKVAEKHIAWCSRYGVDFLAVGWWPKRDQQNAIIADGLMKAKNLGDTKFCIFYETWNLGFDTMLGITLFTDEVMDYFVKDVMTVAKKYFNHPSYLKVNGRPVMIFYLTRSVYVNYEKAFKRLRAELKKAGYDPYFIGDEIFWKVIEAKGSWDPKTPKPKPTDSTEPQTDRVRLFDAVTCYNLYEGGKPHHAGYGAQSAHVKEVRDKFQLYLDKMPDGVALGPQVLPGYNDRGVRLGVNHYVISRKWDRDAPFGSFFDECLDRIAFKFMDPGLNMFMITSWNEWNEDTSIEPLNPAPPTSQDVSKSGRDFTQGFAYQGYGTRYLEILRDKVVAVAGRVLGPDGKPRGQVAMAAWTGGKEVARDLSDSQGYYRLSRLRMPAGEYLVGPADGKLRHKVMVTADRAATAVDFNLTR